MWAHTAAAPWHHMIRLCRKPQSAVPCCLGAAAGACWTMWGRTCACCTPAWRRPPCAQRPTCSRSLQAASRYVRVSVQRLRLQCAEPVNTHVCCSKVPTCSCARPACRLCLHAGQGGMYAANVWQRPARLVAGPCMHAGKPCRDVPGDPASHGCMHVHDPATCMQVLTHAPYRCMHPACTAPRCRRDPTCLCSCSLRAATQSTRPPASTPSLRTRPSSG